MEFVEYMKIKKRMVKSDTGGNCSIACGECPLSNTHIGKVCSGFEMVYPEKAEAIVQKWAEEHPLKTMLQEFLEHYPNAILDVITDTPEALCPSDLGYNDIDECERGIMCHYCWTQPMPDER